MGEEHVIDLALTAEDDRIREFMAMNQPAETDAQTGRRLNPKPKLAEI